MTNSSNSEQSKLVTLAWRGYFLLASILGGLTILSLLQARSDDRSLLGLSASRLVIVALVLSFSIFTLWMLLRSYRRSGWFQRQVVGRSIDWVGKSHIYGIAVILSLLGLLAGLALVLMTPDVTEPFSRAILVRVQPFALWGSGICAQTLLLLLLLRHGLDKQKLYPIGRWAALFILFIGLVYIGWKWVAENAFATESQVVGWNELGAPLLDTQVLLAWTIGMLALVVITLLDRLPERSRWARFATPRTADILVAVLIWLVTVITWITTPLSPSWFVSEPRDPNFEFYPNSDALSYDMTSQLLLVGEELQFVGTPYIRRPLHALFLTGLHATGGQDYETITNLQIVVLALLPVIIYLLVKTLHNRLSGMLAGVLVMLREANSIAIAETVTTSHAKLLMSDLPITLCVVALVYVLVLWLRSPEKKKLLALLSGGLLGTCMLIRPETGILLFPILLVLTIIYWGKKRNLLVNASMLVLGIVLIISPWIWRNWKLTGLVFLDSPSFRFELISERYKTAGEMTISDDPMEEAIQPPANPTPSPDPGSIQPETTPTTGETPYIPYVSNVIDQTMDFIRENFSQVSTFLFANTMNSHMQIFLVLPTSYRIFDSTIRLSGHRDSALFWEECCSLENYVRRLPYWHDWDGNLPSEALIPLVVNIFLVALGVYLAWKEYRLVGLLPVLLGITYIMLNALFRNSGGRYILPVDWIGIVYFSIGLAHVTIKGVSLVVGRDLFSGNHFLGDPPVKAIEPSQKPILRNPAFYALCAGLLFVGSLLPVLESTVPSPYSADRKAAMLDNFLGSELLSVRDRTRVEKALESGGQANIGRALFPRFYPGGEGEPGTANPMGPQDFRRLGFYLAGPYPGAQIMPVEKKPTYFPNAADVLVILDANGHTVAVGVYNGTDYPIVIMMASPAQALNWRTNLVLSYE